MMALLVTGVTNLGAMAIITAAITLERLAPSPTLVARTAGVVMITAGVFVIAQGASHPWSL
jgi:predicted metal-binding membrane protein